MFYGGMTVLVLLAIVAYLPCWIFAAVFRFVLKPLEIPDSYSALASRERRLMVVTYSTLLIVGAPILLLMYLIGFIRHLRRQRFAHEWKEPDANPLIPRFTLSDMLAMVFSLGCTPALYQASQVGKATDSLLVIFFASLLTFPACFLAALYRLNLHDVPSGPVRMAVVALAPFIAIASAGIIPYAFFSLSRELTPQVTTAVFLMILLAGRALARKAAELGHAATAVAVAEPV